MSGQKSAANDAINFVAINYIDCTAEYVDRFEHLFGTRAGAIDRIEGFVRMQVLRADDPTQPYLIVSEWSSEDAFRSWVDSDEFREGHKRGFEDLKAAKDAGLDPPMKSTFRTYRVIAR